MEGFSKHEVLEQADRTMRIADLMLYKFKTPEDVIHTEEELWDMWETESHRLIEMIKHLDE